MQHKFNIIDHPFLVVLVVNSKLFENHNSNYFQIRYFLQGNGV